MFKLTARKGKRWCLAGNKVVIHPNGKKGLCTGHVWRTERLLSIVSTDIVWGDRDNKVLMKSLQILQNKVAKVILDRPNRSSSSDALATLKWESLEERRKAHRSSFVKKTLLNNVNTSNARGNEIHTYNTRNKGNFTLDYQIVELIGGSKDLHIIF